MAWMKVETAVARNRKFVKAGPAASWLWICGLAFCQEGLTDGLIPSESLPFLGVKAPLPLAASLVQSGLWDVVPDFGWRVHDYLGHNKSADKVREIQDDKRRAGEKGGLASGASRRGRTEATGEADAEADAEAESKHPAKHPANPDRTDRADSSDQNRSEQTDAGASHRAGRPLSPIQQPRRKDAAWEGPRLYVPQRLHGDFLALRNGEPQAEANLLAWYELVSNEWTDGPRRSDEPGADMFAFWKTRYAERWPASAAVRSTSSRDPEWLRKARQARS